MGISGFSRYHNFEINHWNHVIQKMPFRQLFMIMAVAALIVSAVSIYFLYTTAIEQHRLRLVEVVKSQARLIESIARFDKRFDNADNSEFALKATLQQVAAAHDEFEGFGETGEFTLARLEGDQIVFVLSRRHLQSETPHPIPFAGEWAEPMRQALSGKSGVLTGLDYRGETVLAAYEPVSVLDLGLVAKIDTREIRAPFLRAGLISFVLATMIIYLSSRLFFRISRPIAESIEQQAETFRTLAETTREGIILADTGGVIQFVNPAAEKLFGYQRDELLGRNVDCLMPLEHGREHEGYMRNYLETGVPRIIGSGRQLTALRKNGTRFPIYLSVGDINLSHTRLFAGVILDISEQQELQRQILNIPIDEQRRIGQELHDGLGQQLTGLGLLATSLMNRAAKPDHELATKLASGIQEAIAQVRALSRGLMPLDIDSDGFMHALENLIDEICAQSEIKIKLKIDEPVRIADNNIALHLFRIAQEALNNAVKHSEANEIKVSLGIEEGRGCLSVVDNGRGLPSDNIESSGLGLRTMKHRCSLIDAEFQILSSSETGTEIRCYFVSGIENRLQ